MVIMLIHHRRNEDAGGILIPCSTSRKTEGEEPMDAVHVIHKSQKLLKYPGADSSEAHQVAV